MNTYMPLTEDEIVITSEGFEHKAPTFTKINNLILGNHGEPGLISYLKEAEIRLYFAINRFTVGYQRSYWQASHSTISEQTRMGRKAIMVAAETLSKKGLISYTRIKGVTIWRIHPENIAPFLATMSPKDSTQSADTGVPKTQEMSPKDSSNESQRLQSGVLKTRPSKKEIKEIEKETQTNARVCQFQNISPLAKAMATALGLDLQVTQNLDCINVTLKKLQSLYGDDVTEHNIIKVSSLVLGHYGASPAKVYSQWQTFMRDTAPKSATEQKAATLTADIESVANRIKAICKPPSPLGWEHSSVKPKKRLLTELATAIAMNHQESRLDSFSWWGGSQQPSIDQFGKAWVDHTAKGILPSRNSQIDIQENNRRAEEWLVGATVGA